MTTLFKLSTILILASLVTTMSSCSLSTVSANKSGPIPDPTIDAPLAKVKGEQTAVLAGGCFWGIEAVFEHVKGVTHVESGYAGGSADNADYRTVSAGRTGHAESVHITYDPSQVTYGQLLKVFFAVAHDPTELNRQGPDTGTQYRSAIFYGNDEQKRIAEGYIAQLDGAKIFAQKIVTQVVPLKGFYEAEGYHQDYYNSNPNQMYCRFVIMPKIEKFEKVFKDKLKTGITNQ